MNRHHRASQLIQLTDDIPAHMKGPGIGWFIILCACASAFFFGAWLAFTLLSGL